MAAPNAVPKEQQNYLLFSNLPSAQTRSKQMASGMHTDGVFTVFWYNCTQLTDGRGAISVDPDGSGTAYTSKPGPTALSQLTPSEIAALVPWATVQPLWPPQPPS
jgi:hypothetical protein